VSSQKLQTDTRFGTPGVPLQIDSAKIGLHMLSFMCFVTEGPAVDMVCRCIAANEFCGTISDGDGGGGG
jgi:hypothetical protein